MNLSYTTTQIRKINSCHKRRQTIINEDRAVWHKNNNAFISFQTCNTTIRLKCHQLGAGFGGCNLLKLTTKHSKKLIRDKRSIVRCFGVVRWDVWLGGDMTSSVNIIATYHSSRDKQSHHYLHLQLHLTKS